MAADIDRRVPPDELAANKAELNDIRQELSDGVGLTARALERLRQFIGDGRWQRCTFERPGTVADFIAANFGILAELSIPAEDRMAMAGLLKAHDLTQQVIADLLGVDQKTISNDLRNSPKALTSGTVQKSAPPTMGRPRKEGSRNRAPKVIAGEVIERQPQPGPAQQPGVQQQRPDLAEDWKAWADSVIANHVPVISQAPALHVRAAVARYLAGRFGELAERWSS